MDKDMFNGDDFYDKLFDSLMNIDKDQKKSEKGDSDEVLQNFLDAANRWNKAEAQRAKEEEAKRRVIEEERKKIEAARKRKAQEKKEREEEKFADAVALVRTIDEFTAKWYPVAGMTDAMDDDAYESSAKALIKLLDKVGPLGLGLI